MKMSFPLLLNTWINALEYLFHQADADGSGTVEYHEFKKVWLDLVNPRKELEKRDIELPLFMTPWALKAKLAEVVEAEEDQEAHAIATAEAFRTHMQNLAQKEDRCCRGTQACPYRVSKCTRCCWPSLPIWKWNSRTIFAQCDTTRTGIRRISRSR